MIAVLLAEENPILRKDTTHALELHGYTVIQANDGQSLLEILDNADHRPDIVISDIRLFTSEMFTRLKHHRSNIPVLLLSAFHSHQLDPHFHDLKVEDFVLKPFHIDELIFAIEGKLNL